MKHTIWTNDLDFDDWKKDLEEEHPGYDENDLIKLMYELNDDYLSDEKVNLDKQLDNILIMYGTLNLWNASRFGYRFLSSSNLNGIFTGACGDYVTWYVEGEDIKCDDAHHDGTNHYTYRALKKEFSADEFEEYSWDNGFDKALEEMTEPLGHYVAEIYGFDLQAV